jgi:magnesium-transporting ATPase (P-type)
MRITISFYLSIAFIVATLATMYPPKNDDLHQNLHQHLTSEEQQHYNNIIVMRRNIYFQGLVLGIILAIAAIHLIPVLNKAKKNNRLFTAIAITFVVNYFYYILSPKDKYMIEILNTKEENKAWLEIYKSMQFRYHAGFLFGLAAASCIHHCTIF